jgi:phosphoenolpyruvate-protein kinase (PTS system EI component)
MLALDRDEAELSHECTAWHPLVLRAIRQVFEAAAEHGCPVSICGEEAGEPDFARLMAGFGARQFSMSPARAAAVRSSLRGFDCRMAQETCQAACLCETPADVRQIVAGISSPD